jgi:hypothetical protein
VIKLLICFTDLFVKEDGPLQITGKHLIARQSLLKEDSRYTEPSTTLRANITFNSVDV